MHFLLEVDQYGTLNLLHSLFSAPVNLYLTVMRLFDCRGNLPNEGLYPVVELPAESCAVRHSMRAIIWADHVGYLGESLPDQMTGDALQSGRESLNRLQRLGVPGVDLHPPRLRYLDPK